MSKMGCGPARRRRRLCSRGGFTLAEMLIAVIILLLATTAIAAVMQLAVRNARGQEQRSDAELLCQTLASSVRGELTYAGGVTDEGGVVTFDSHARGVMDCRFMICGKDGEVYSDPADDFGAAGRLDLVQKDGETVSFDLPLADDAMYEHGALRASMALDWDAEAEHFGVRLTVWDTQGGELCAEEFTVRPISPG